LTDIEKIIEEATISLPRPLKREEAEKMLKYIAQEMPANVIFKTEHFKNFLNEEGKVKLYEGTLKINGTIVNKAKPFTLEYFSLEPSSHQTELVDKLVFNMVGSDGLEGYSQGIRELRERTRTVVGQYFAKEVFPKITQKNKA